jgi:LuxR family transcriptional regulator, quorum-sensing system regulator BjaR1
VLRLVWFIPPPAHAVKHDKTLLLHWGFAPEWSNLYNSMPDEVPRNVEAVTRAGRPVMWRDAMAAIRAKRPGAKWPLLDEFVRLHPEEGFVFPLFGPFATEAVISCAAVPTISSFNDPRFVALAAAADEALRKIALIKHQEYRDAIRLSPREQAVLRGLGAGQSKKEIARQMDIAPSSVDTYARRIFFKLQVDDRVEAVVKAVSLGLVKL